MTFRFLIFAIFTSFALQANAELVFEKKQIVATVPPGAQSYNFEFAFTNTGNEGVEIADIKSDCDCTDVTTDKKSYAATEKGVLKGTFSVGDRLGRQDKRIIITTVSGEKMVLSLLLTVPELASFRPKMLMWKSGESASPKTLRVDTAREYGAVITSVDCDDPNLKIEFSPQKEHTDSCEIRITPVSLEKEGRSELRLTCATKGGVQKVFTVHLMVK